MEAATGAADGGCRATRARPAACGCVPRVCLSQSEAQLLKDKLTAAKAAQGSSASAAPAAPHVRHSGRCLRAAACGLCCGAACCRRRDRRAAAHAAALRQNALAARAGLRARRACITPPLCRLLSPLGLPAPAHAPRTCICAMLQHRACACSAAREPYRAELSCASCCCAALAARRGACGASSLRCHARQPAAASPRRRPTPPARGSERAVTLALAAAHGCRRLSRPLATPAAAAHGTARASSVRHSVST
jgi:hypothetical protein